MQDHELDLIRDELVKAMRLAEQGKHRQAIDVCTRCLRNAEQRAMPLPEGFVGALLTRMGLSMAALSEWDDALYHYRLAEGILLRRKNTIREVRAQFHVALYRTEDDMQLLLADIYQALGQAYEAREEWELAVDYFKRAFKMAQAMENIGLAWRALNALAMDHQTRNLWPDLLSLAEHMLQLNALDSQPTREIVARRYLAQAYGRTGYLNEMLVELERIVAIGRETGYADLASDERVLARAQQMAPKNNDTDSVKSVSLITVDAERAVVTSNADFSALPDPVMPEVAHSNPTPPELTDCPPDLIHDIQIETSNERGVREAAFVLQTRHLDRAVALFDMFRLSLLPISIPGMAQLGDASLGLPQGGQIFVEWSMHDLMPDTLLNSVVIPDDQHDVLEYANRDTHNLAIYLESKDGGPFGKRKRVPLPGLFSPYVLDWCGIVGVVRFLRRRYLQANGGLSAQEARHLITLLETPIKDGLPATGIYREMGLIYRLIKDHDQALRCLKQEIVFNMDSEGMPSIHTSQAFRQLGLIYREREQDDLAHDAFSAALAVNPNSYESLTALASIVDDPTDALRYLGRAYRIRKQDSSWARVIEAAASKHDRTVEQVEQATAIIATQVNLSARYEWDRALLLRLGIV
ncbi:MAG: tetratricopeptide repeat protein [Anaerolineae bacterium]|nr:tetratricopeptide repeat protein [Anaerolineae bacterium]